MTLCNVCEFLTKEYGSNESVLPWYCKCDLFQVNTLVKSKQKTDHSSVFVPHESLENYRSHIGILPM